MMLVVAEVQKTLRRPFDIALTIATLALSVLMPLIPMVRGFRDPARAALHAAQITWPVSMDRATVMLTLMAVIGAPMLAASAFGNENDARTWATLVSRRSSRYPLLLAKVVVVFATITVVTALAVLTTLVTARVAVAILGVAPDPAVMAKLAPGPVWPEPVLSSADAWWSALMAIAGAALLRSTLAAALIGILLPRLFVVALSEETASFNPAAHFMSLRHAAGLLPRMPVDVGLDWWGSVAVILACAMALIAAMAYWFEHREIDVG